MTKVKAPSTIKKRIQLLEGYRKDCMKKLKEAIESKNERGMVHYSKEQQTATLRIKDLQWVIGEQ